MLLRLQGAGFNSQLVRVSAGKARVLVSLDLIGVNQLFLISPDNM